MWGGGGGGGGAGIYEDSLVLTILKTVFEGGKILSVKVINLLYRSIFIAITSTIMQYFTFIPFKLFIFEPKASPFSTENYISANEKQKC